MTDAWANYEFLHVRSSFRFNIKPNTSNFKPSGYS